MASDATTLDVYSREAQAYADRHDGGNDKPFIERFSALLPAGASVLDLGCGPGHSSVRLGGRGFAVTPVDGSAGMAKEAARRFGLEARVPTFEELDYESAFDGVWAGWSLHHAAHEATPGIMEAIARALKPEGVLLMSVKTGTGARRDSLDRFYAYYDEALARETLDLAGFEILHLETGEGTGFDGEACGTLAVIARRTR